MPCSRREFVSAAVLSTVAAVALGVVAPLDAMAEAGASPALRDQILSMAKNVVDDGGVGEAFLSSIYAEDAADADALTELLVRRIALTANDDAQAAIRLAIAEDFSAEHVCHVKDWYLSMTECRLAGLAHLLRPEGDTDQETGGASASFFDKATFGKVVTVTGWGPTSTQKGVPFLVQGDGHSGMWFTLTAPIPRVLEVYISGEQVKGVTISGETLTLKFEGAQRDELINAVGKHEVVFLNGQTATKQLIGVFEVTPSDEAVPLCAPTNWGPQSIARGEPFNVQSDGSVAFWFEVDCFPANAEVVLGGKTLTPTFAQGLLTATTADLAFIRETGALDITLRNPATSQELTVGKFSVK